MTSSFKEKDNQRRQGAFFLLGGAFSVIIAPAYDKE